MTWTSKHIHCPLFTINSQLLQYLLLSKLPLKLRNKHINKNKETAKKKKEKKKNLAENPLFFIKQIVSWNMFTRFREVERNNSIVISFIPSSYLWSIFHTSFSYKEWEYQLQGTTLNQLHQATNRHNRAQQTANHEANPPNMQLYTEWKYIVGGINDCSYDLVTKRMKQRKIEKKEFEHRLEIMLYKGNPPVQTTNARTSGWFDSQH